MTSEIAFRLYNTPLMILPSKLDVIVQALAGGDLPRGRSSERQRPSTTDRISVIPLHGVFAHRGWWPFGATYAEVGAMLHEALDSDTSAILLDIDTPGGVVAGVLDLGDEIHASQKPVYAFVNESGYSAGYLLASSAKKVFLPRTGGVGSIGVRMIHVDQSELNKKTGIKVTNLFVGERKVDFDPHSPLSKEAQEAAMKELREIYDLFADTVARNRGMTVQAVKGTEAALYMGQHAVEAGLADQVMTFDEAIAFIVEDVAATGKTSKSARGAIGGKESFTMNIEREVSEMQDKAFAMRGKIASIDDRLTRMERGTAEEVSITEARREKEQYLKEQAQADEAWLCEMKTIADDTCDGYAKKRELQRLREFDVLTPAEAKARRQEDLEDEKWLKTMLAKGGQRET